MPLSAARSRDTAVAVVCKGSRHRLGPKDLIFITHSNRVWSRTTHPSAAEGDFSGDSQHCKTPLHTPDFHTLLVKSIRDVNDQID